MQPSALTSSGQIELSRRLNWARQLVVHLLNNDADALERLARRSTTSRTSLLRHTSHLERNIARCVELGIEDSQSGLRGRTVERTSALIAVRSKGSRAAQPAQTSALLDETIACAVNIAEFQLNTLMQFNRSTRSSLTDKELMRKSCVVGVSTLIAMGVSGPDDGRLASQPQALGRVLLLACASANTPDESAVDSAVRAVTQR